MIEQIMKDYAASNSSFCAIALRYFNPIGAHSSGLIGESPNDIPNNLMPYIMRVANGHLPHLNVFGSDYNTVDGTGVRDYIHVVDLAKGHLAALAKYEKPWNGALGKACQLKGYNVFNLGTGNGTSVLQLTHAFEKASGIKIKTVKTGRRAGDAACCLAIPSRANKVLGWKTEYNIEEMCRDTWKWAKMNPNGYESNENGRVKRDPAKNSVKRQLLENLLASRAIDLKVKNASKGIKKNTVQPKKLSSKTKK